MKIGVVIVTHYRLGEEFLQALRLIVPDAPPFHAVVDRADAVRRGDARRDRRRRSTRADAGRRAC